MTGGPGNARWPLHCSGRRVKNQDADARAFSESQGFGKDKCRGLGATAMEHQAWGDGVGVGGQGLRLF